MSHKTSDRDISKWPLKFSIPVKNQCKVLYIDENKYISEDRMEQIKSQNNDIHYRSFENILGSITLLAGLKKLMYLQSIGEIDTINLAMVKSEGAELTLEAAYEIYNGNEYEIDDQNNRVSRVMDDTPFDFIVNKVVEFLKTDRSRKYFNIVTMKPITCTPSHISTDPNMRMVVPKRFNDHMRDSIYSRGIPVDIEPKELLDRVEKLVILKMPSFGIGKEIEKEDMIIQEEKLDTVKLFMQRVKLNGKGKALSVRNIKSDSVDDVPNKRVSVGVERIPRSKVLSVVPNRETPVIGNGSPKKIIRGTVPNKEHTFSTSKTSTTNNMTPITSTSTTIGTVNTNNVTTSTTTTNKIVANIKSKQIHEAESDSEDVIVVEHIDDEHINYSDMDDDISGDEDDYEIEEQNELAEIVSSDEYSSDEYL